MSWTHPICERCWIERESVWEELANGTEQLVEVRKPSTLRITTIEECCFCKQITIMGIYVRHDPKKLQCNHD